MHLPAARRVEGRVDELDQEAAVGGRDGAHLRGLLERLVAREGRAQACGAGPVARLLDQEVAPAAAGAGPRADALAVHQVLEALRVDAEALLGGQLHREVEGEAVRVVELEGLLGADPLGAGLARPLDVLGEEPRALLQRLAERLLLGREPHVDRPGLRVQLGVARAHELAHDGGEAGQERALDADPAALQHRAPHEAAQHVAAVLVGRDDAVGDQEGHPPRVVGENAQRPVDVDRLAVAAARTAPPPARSAGGTGPSRRSSACPAG